MAVLQRECGGTFVTNRPSTLKHFRALYPDVQTQRRYRYFKWMGGHKLLSEADVIFTGAGYNEYLPQFSAKKFMLFHGTLGGINDALVRRFTHFDHMFLIGPRMEQQIARYNHKYNIPYTVTGFLPFALYPENTEETKHEILRKLGLDHSKKTIVYTPSKASFGTWLYAAEDIAQQTPLDFNLILRPHPNQALSGSKQDKTSFKRVSNILKNRPNGIIDLSICSLPELECIADLMITDANSPSEESMFYDCAQLFSDAHLSSKKAFIERFNEWDMHPEDTEGYMQLFDCGPKFHEEGYRDWGKAIHTAIETKGDYADARSQCFRYIFGERDRLASKRVAERIGDLLQE